MSPESLRILITNWILDDPDGTSLYVRDLAIALLARGHRPVVYSRIHGDVAAQIRAAAIPVVDNLDQLGAPPDIIHGHHHIETVTALLRFPTAPAIFICHGPIPMQEAPPKFPRIILYLAVSKASRDRLVLQNGISEDRVRLVLNFVDLNRFLPRDPLPEVPRRALVFGNHFNEKFGLATIREVCAKSGLQLNALGGGGGRLVRHPEKLLHDYDIVFAKGRCALEALTVGCAVVLCSVEGIGPTIRPANVDGLRLHNFGAGTLTTPLSTELLVERIKEYNSVEAAEVSKRVREIAGTDTAVDEMQRIYREVVATHEQAGPADPNQEMKLVSDYLREWGSTFYGWQPEAHYRKVSAKLDAVYASATWRWTQGFLRLPGLRFLLAPIVRRVARTPREPK